RDHQLIVPLVQEVDCGRDHEGRPPNLGNGQDGNESLAGPGRQHDDTPAALLPPSIQGLGLVRKRLPAGQQGPGRRLPRACLVLVGELLLSQPLNDRAVASPLRTVVARARVEAAARKGGYLLRRATGENQGAALKCKVDWLGVHENLMPSWPANV